MSRILLVEDENDIRTALAAALKLRGHTVTEAASSDNALALAARDSFDIAIIDYVLPGKRGLDLLFELRKLDPFLRSIIISGQIDHDLLDATEVERQLKEQIVADRYVAKPASTDTILRAIEDILGTGEAVDWQLRAADAIAATDVTAKQVRTTDRALRAARKKRSE